MSHAIKYYFSSRTVKTCSQHRDGRTGWRPGWPAGAGGPQQHLGSLPPPRPPSDRRHKSFLHAPGGCASSFPEGATYVCHPQKRQDSTPTQRMPARREPCCPGHRQAAHIATLRLQLRAASPELPVLSATLPDTELMLSIRLKVRGRARPLPQRPTARTPRSLRHVVCSSAHRCESRPPRHTHYSPGVPHEATGRDGITQVPAAEWPGGDFRAAGRVTAWRPAGGKLQGPGLLFQEMGLLPA